MFLFLLIFYSLYIIVLLNYFNIGLLGIYCELHLNIGLLGICCGFYLNIGLLGIYCGFYLNVGLLWT